MTLFGFRMAFHVSSADGFVGLESLEAHVDRVADALFSDATITDVSIGLDEETQVVELEATAEAPTKGMAVNRVAEAVIAAIGDAGGNVDAFTLIPHDPPLGDPITELTIKIAADWEQTSLELVDA